MLASKQSARVSARARLHAETPAPFDLDYPPAVQEEAAAIIEKARGLSGPTSDELLARAVNDVSRSYYHYLMRRRLRGHKPPGGEA